MEGWMKGGGEGWMDDGWMAGGMVGGERGEKMRVGW